MKVLVTYGSKMGGTAGIAHIIADALATRGLDVELDAANTYGDVDGFDAVVVGGALYANRWHKDARRFVKRNIPRLQRIPVWFFSSGPLDDSALRAVIGPVPQVVALMEAVHARGHQTFGGRLEKTAKGFIARSMARTHAGDWRDAQQIQRWALGIAHALAPEEAAHAPMA